MKSPTRILCSAQHFGYGPLAELIALERALRLDERGAAVRLLLPENHALGALQGAVRQRFHLHPSAPGARLADGDPEASRLPLASFLADPELANVDAVLSSFDSAVVFFGWFIGKPVHFYDGLFWFWNFDPYRHLVAEHLEALRRVRDRRDAQGLLGVYRRMLDIHYHFTVLVAYHLATRTYARNGFGTAERLVRYPELADRTRVVGAVIDPTAVEAAPVERAHVLVSLSGSLAPLLSFEQNLAFARGALQFTIEARTTLGGRLPWYFCCHPLLYEALGKEGRLGALPVGLHATPSFDYHRNLEMIRHAQALFISPGFSSIQEAAAFRTPVFFLPEQNGGQPAQMLMLRQAGYDASTNWTVTDVLCEGRPSISEDDIEALYRGVAELWGESLRPARLAALERFRQVLSDEGRRSAFVRKQREAVRRVFGDFDGARSVAGHVLDHLGAPRVAPPR